MNYFLILFTALLTLFCLYAIRKIFPKVGLLDNPKKFGYKRKPVPYPAGIIIPLIFFSILQALVPSTEALFRPLLGFTIASAILVITSFLDDRYELSPRFRLLIQFIAALVIIAFGIGIPEIRLPFGETLNLEIWKIEMFGKNFVLIADTLAILWIIFMTNAFNWLDGISGLTSSIGAICTGILSIVALLGGQPDIAIIFAIFATICLIFFLFDIDPPKVLMGDSGAMFIGFSLAVFTIIAGGKIATLMLVAFAPIFDTIWTIIRRLLKKQSPFKGDFEHLHHKLLKVFKSRKLVVYIYAGLTLLFGSIAIFLNTQEKMYMFIILFIFMVGLEVYLHKKLNYSSSSYST